MMFWGQLSLQDSMSIIMELMTYFHDHMMMLLSIIMVFVSYIFLLVLISDKMDRFTIDSHVLEFIWTVVPMVFLIFMALPSLYLLYLTEDHPYSYYNIKVTGHQWYWDYQYDYNFSSQCEKSYMVNEPSSGSYRCLDVDNSMMTVNNMPFMIMVTSDDVLHSWTVPSLGVKVDAIPGRLNYLMITPINYGVFYGQCSELCGSNHSFMPIRVEVLGLSDFLGYVMNLE